MTGDVFELDPTAAAARVLEELDAYEGAEFERVAVEVSLAGETRVSALAYLFAGSAAGLPRVAHGDWLRRPETLARSADSAASAGVAPPRGRG